MSSVIRWLRAIYWMMKNVQRHVMGVLIGQPQYDIRALIKAGAVEIAPSTRFYCVPRIKRFPGSNAKLVIKGYGSLSSEALVFVGGQHAIDTVTTYPHRILWRMPGVFEDGFPTNVGDSFIGGDVWLGDGAVVMPGLRIGHGAVIGSNSVVTKDVPDYAIVGGIPAKVIRYRFPEEQVRRLVASQWWEWPEEEVRACVPLLANTDIEGFLAYAESRTAG